MQSRSLFTLEALSFIYMSGIVEGVKLGLLVMLLLLLNRAVFKPLVKHILHEQNRASAMVGSAQYYAFKDLMNGLTMNV